MYNKNFVIGRSRKKYNSISQINVTPFVDVMLVLLIVFMITAPLLTVGVTVDLPKVKEVNVLRSEGDPIEISIKNNGEIFIQERKIDPSKMLPSLTAISSANKNLRIYLSVGSKVDWGKVMETISKIKDAGFKKVALRAKHKES